MPISHNQERQRAIASTIVGAVIAILIAIFAFSRYRTMNAPPPRPYDVVAATPIPKATPAPPEPTPRPTPQPGAPDLRLKFQRSDAPMTGVVVLVEGRAPLDLPANGEIALLPEGVPVRIYDRETSVTMADLPDGGTLRGVVELPPPVRLAGRLVDPAGGSVTALSLSWGHGEEVTVAERERRRTGSMLRPSPNESSPWGIDLPPGPAEWQQLTPAEDGTFTTKWFLAAGAAPSVVAFDATGRSAFARVPFAETLLPRATMDAGAMTLQDPAVLEIEVDFPPGERAADLAAGIRWAKVLPEYAEQSAMILNLLDRIDPQVAGFASGEGNYPVVRPGVTRIAPLPPLGPLLLVMRGPMPGKVPEREIALKPGETTRVHITAEEIFPIGGPTYDAEFRVVLKGSLIPIKDAKIVVSMWRRSEEGVTDDKGAFRVKDLPADQQIQVQVDAFDSHDPPRYAESKSTVLYPDTYSGEAPHYIDISGFRWIVLKRGNLVARALPGGEPIISLLQWSKPEATWTVAQVDDSSFSDEDLWVNFSYPGRYKFEIQTEPLVIFESTEVELGPDDFFGEVNLVPAARATREVKIFVHDAAGKPVAGLEVDISEGVTIGKSSIVTQVVTDAEGMASVGPCNVDRLRYSYMYGDELVYDSESVSGDVAVIVYQRFKQGVFD